MNYFCITHELLDVDPLIVSEEEEPLPGGLVEDWVWSVVGPPYVWVDGTDNEKMMEAVGGVIERIKSRYMCLEELGLGFVACLYGAEDVDDIVYRSISDLGMEDAYEIVQDGDGYDPTSCVVMDVRDSSRTCRVSRDVALGLLSVESERGRHVSSWRDALHPDEEEELVVNGLRALLDQ